MSVHISGGAEVQSGHTTIMTFGRNQQIVPVLTFHSVGMSKDNWIWNHLSERAEIFERTLQRLRKGGYRTVTLSQLYDHMSGIQLCPPKSIVLVFDDGYLDNWVTVYPLLKKYGMCGAVYVNPEFVEPSEEIRPTIDDLEKGSRTGAEMRQSGFMSWAELKVANDAGVLDVQSHSLTHTWYFTGPKIVDYYCTEHAERYPWMQWNARPDRKPFYLVEDQTGYVPTGAPVFEHEKSLIARKFFPDEDIVQTIISRHNQHSGQRCIDHARNFSTYANLVSSILGTQPIPGYLESVTERKVRVRQELISSKSIIEEKLDKTVDYICWPGGGVDEGVKKMARQVGYRSWTLPSREKPSKRNLPNSDPGEIRRLPAVRDVFFFGKKWGSGSEVLTLLEIFAHQNSSLYDLLRKAYKVSLAIRSVGKR